MDASCFSFVTFFSRHNNRSFDIKGVSSNMDRYQKPTVITITATDLLKQYEVCAISF
jgi:hypothetical protein